MPNGWEIFGQSLASQSYKEFSIESGELQEFIELIAEIAESSLYAIDENHLFVVECNASEAAISVTLNQGGRSVVFMSRTLRGNERHHLALEKEVTAIIEAVPKWEHLLARKHFTLINDHKSVAFTFENGQN